MPILPCSTLLIALCLLVFSLSQVQSYKFVENDWTAVPSIVIAGFAKCGTTDLYSHIVDVFGSSVRRPKVKESRQLNRFLDSYHEHWENWVDSKPYFDYLHLLNHPCKFMPHRPALDECFQNQASLNLTIDASPNYILRADVAQLLHSYSPASKVIIIMRNPIAAAISFYHHFYSHGVFLRPINVSMAEFLHCVEHPDIQPGLRDLLGATQAADIARMLREVLTPCGLPHESAAFLQYSFVHYLRVWHELYLQRDRALILDAHLYFSDRTSVFNYITQFLFNRNLLASERMVSEQHSIIGSNFSRGASEIVQLGSGVEALSPCLAARFARFLQPHTEHFLKFVRTLKDDGYNVFGFNSRTWRHAVDPATIEGCAS